MKTPRIAIVALEPQLATLLADRCRGAGYAASIIPRGAVRDADVVICAFDVPLPDVGGADRLVVLEPGQPAAAALDAGASEVIPRACTSEDMVLALRRTLRLRALRRENGALRQAQLDGNVQFRVPKEGMAWEDHERECLRQALELTAGNRAQAARLLSLPYKAMLYRLDKFDLVPKRKPSSETHSAPTATSSHNGSHFVAAMSASAGG